MPAAVIFLLISACGDATAVPQQATSTPTIITQGRTATPGTTPTQTRPLVLPTRHPGTSRWAEKRIDAVVALYQPTKAGEALLRSLDFRQMVGDPGFFGSYGFAEWAGVGEASPIGVIHELGHSYWGGFPVGGRPDLSWEVPADGSRSPAMQNYHRDILALMAQPPDDFEIFRQRLRNLPDISSGNPEPVFHNLEADVLYNTGGSSELVPPILQKY